MWAREQTQPEKLAVGPVVKLGKGVSWKVLEFKAVLIYQNITSRQWVVNIHWMDWCFKCKQALKGEITNEWWETGLLRPAANNRPGFFSSPLDFNPLQLVVTTTIFPQARGGVHALSVCVQDTCRVNSSFIRPHCGSVRVKCVVRKKYKFIFLVY